MTTGSFVVFFSSYNGGTTGPGTDYVSGDLLLTSRQNIPAAVRFCGVWGYYEFLEALTDPKHEQHDDFVQWGGDFDPDEFNVLKTTKAMRRGILDWRQM